MQDWKNSLSIVDAAIENVQKREYILIADSSLSDRLSSFKCLLWFDKPIDAVTCARHGWSNTSSDTLTCTECSSTLVYGENTDYKQFLLDLKNSHLDTCQWRHSSLDKSKYRFPSLSRNHSRTAFMQRFNSFITGNFSREIIIINNPVYFSNLDCTSTD